MSLKLKKNYETLSPDDVDGNFEFLLSEIQKLSLLVNHLSAHSASSLSADLSVTGADSATVTSPASFLLSDGKLNFAVESLCFLGKFSSEYSYKPGSFVFFNDSLWLLLTSNFSGTWDPSKWVCVFSSLSSV